MRSVSDDISVRLYHLDADSGVAMTLLYGTLSTALARAAAEPEASQEGLFIQTGNDVVAYLDLIEG